MKAVDIINLCESDIHCAKIKKILNSSLEDPIDCEVEKKSDKSYVYSGMGHSDKKDKDLLYKLRNKIDDYFRSVKASSDTSGEIQEQSDNLYAYLFETTVTW